MAKDTTAAEREKAQDKLAAAQENLAKAQEEAAEAGATLAAVVTREVPDMIVEVLPGNEVKHGDKLYTEGQKVSLEGPTAVALLQMGHVMIRGSAS